MKKNIPLLLLSILLSAHSFSQPYLDILNVKYTNSPAASIFDHDKHPVQLNYFTVSATIPFLFKNKKDAVIISPFFENWNTAAISQPAAFKEYNGWCLPVTYLKQLKDSSWRIFTTIIARMNNAVNSGLNKGQFGGALVVSRQANKNVAYKAGLYVNGEYFGLFIVPLLGIDWKINPSTNLFGLLPGNLTLEHRLTKKIYSGILFRSFTNSYATGNSSYWRVDENQSGGFIDLYFLKKFVLNMEAGYSLFRKIREGSTNPKSSTNWNVGDNYYFKAGISYRLRFR